MGKYIDAEHLKELLNNKYKEFTERSKNNCFMQYQFMADGLNIAKQMVDSLQQEQQEVDLEEEIAIYLRTFSSSFENGIEYSKNIARHFAEWGAKHKDSLQVQETCKENPDSFTSLEEAAEDSWALYEYRETPQGLYSSCYRDGFIAGAKWMENQMPMPEDTVIFMKGVEEGRRLEREDRNDDNLPRYYGD